MFKILYVTLLSTLLVLTACERASEQPKITEQTQIKPVVVPKVVPPTAPTREPKPARKRMKLTDLPIAWQRLAMCESSNRPHAISPSGLHHGYFQIHKGFFITKDIDWKTATLEQQWEVAQYVYKRQGAQAWSCADQAGLK